MPNKFQQTNGENFVNNPIVFTLKDDFLEVLNGKTSKYERKWSFFKL